MNDKKEEFLEYLRAEGVEIEEISKTVYRGTETFDNEIVIEEYTFRFGRLIDARTVDIIKV